MGVQVGLGLFTAQLPAGTARTFEQEYREIVDLVRLAETLGFDSAWVSEHHGSSDGYMPSLLPTLAAFAAATDRIKLGTGILLTPFHHPLRLAEDAATVDLISGGRLILGLGLAWREEEFRMFDVPMNERVRRTVETIDILRLAWTGKRFSYEGRAFSFDQVRVTPPPGRKDEIPIWLGGTAESAIRRAGRIADGYIRTRGGNVDRMRHDLHVAEEAASENGRSPDRLAFAQLQNTFVWEDGDAWDVVRAGAAHQIGVYGAWDAGADTPGKDLEVTPPDEELLRKLTPAGTSAQVIAALRPLVEAFAGRREFHLIVRLHYPGMDFETASRAVELFAERVLPALKGA
ncbi:MAG TPA: LLM class flavin-dependent oxidoreductase [Actinomycetota bacterium]|nr:LLM class flavin-dependent oxidoreductase [Actinomycetota bacterium]